MADMNVANVNKQLNTEAKPASAKKEFEQLIRSIRKIAASSRAFSGDFINSLIQETKASSEGKRNWSLAGTAAQALPLAVMLFGDKSDPKNLEELIKMSSKFGDAAASALSTAQFGYQADEQRIQQTLTHYNTFERNMSGLVDSMNAINNQIRQKEMEQN